MKKLIILSLMLLIGCASSNLTKEDLAYRDSRFPPGKTQGDWIKEEKHCRDTSGKITGPLGVSMFGFIHNFGEVNRSYDACMREHGWPGY